MRAVLQGRLGTSISGDEFGDKVMATVEKMPMLQEGYEKLTADLRRLKEERPLIVDAIEEARAHGDLSENAEYHAAKEQQGQNEATIADIEGKLSRAQIIDPKELSGDKVVFGATVTLLDEDDKPVRYQIVGETEADAKQGAHFVQFADRPRADRAQGRRRGRSVGARGRPLLPRQQDRVHLSQPFNWRDAPVTYGIAAVTAIVSRDRVAVGQCRRGGDAGRVHPGVACRTRRCAGSAVTIPVWLTPLTCTLLHGSVIHLLFNMVDAGLLRARDRARAGVGWHRGAVSRRRLCRGGGAVGAEPACRPMPTIGASGAIAAIIAAYALAVSGATARGRSGRYRPGLLHALWLGAAWTCINLMINLAMLTRPAGRGRRAYRRVPGGLILTRPLLLWRYRKA